MEQIRTEIVIVGTGAGGAMVAKELALAGRDIVLVERGPGMDSFAGLEEMQLGRRLYQNEGRFPKTEEGYSLLKGHLVGGTTELAIGHGMRVFEKEFKRLGLDLAAVFEETEEELGIGPMPEAHIGANAGFLTRVAESMNMEITTWTKFIDFDQCTHCGRCVISCPVGAKWSANHILEPLQNRENVRLLTHTRVDHVDIGTGRARGVVCETAQGPLEILADKTILSAGGIGTPVILQRSGLEAGHSLFLDIFPIVYGRSPVFKPVLEPSMPTIFNENSGKGYVLAPHVDTALMFQGIKGWFGDLIPYGVMVKTRDDNKGKVDARGKVFKYITTEDRHRIDTGVKEARELLLNAGVAGDMITVSEIIGGHPGGTAAIGTVVNPELACMNARDLYVCDASVIPESPGRPPIVLIVALAKWLGKVLAA